MTKPWVDPCVAAMNSQNKRIFDAKGNRSVLAARSALENSTGDGDSVAIRTELQKSLDAITRENQQLREQVLRLQRQADRSALIQKAAEEVRTETSEEEQKQFLEDVSFDRKPPKA